MMDTMSDSMWWLVLTMHSSVIFGNCTNYRPDDSYGVALRRCYDSLDRVVNGDHVVVALLDTVLAADDSIAKIHGSLSWSWEILRLTFFIAARIQSEIVTKSTKKNLIKQKLFIFKLLLELLSLQPF